MSTAMTNMASVETPKSTIGVFDLPCGYLDPAGALHQEIELRELTGAEEDLLASRTVPNSKKFNELLFRCTVRLGTITDRGQLNTAVKMLPLGDRLLMLLKVREISIGDDYTFELKCPQPACAQTKRYTVLLSDLEVRKMPDPMKRVFDVALPSGSSARFRLITGLDEERTADQTKGEDTLSAGILQRLELLNGAPPNMTSVKEMKWRDRMALRSMWDKVEGGVDTNLDMTCSTCGHEFKKDLEITPDFFFPSAVSKT